MFVSDIFRKFISFGGYSLRGRKMKKTKKIISIRKSFPFGDNKNMKFEHRFILVIGRLYTGKN